MARLKGIFVMMLLVHFIVIALNPVLILDPENRNYVVAGPFLGDGNDLALSVNLVLPFALLFLLDAKRWIYRVAAMGVLLFLIVCIVLTKSRGGTVALACVAIYYWWNSDRKVLTAALAAVALAGILSFAPANYFARMKMITDTEEGSAQGRILAWTAGVKMAIANPVFGAGAGMFPVTYGVHYRTRFDIPFQTAHSIYFLALGELGVPGIAVLLTFVFANLAHNRRLRQQLRDRPAAATTSDDQRLLVALSASLIAYATGGAFLSALYYPHIYLLGGLLSASRGLVRERLKAADADTAQPEVSVRSVQPAAISPDWRPRTVGAFGPGQAPGRLG
jgi:probable O-glycosylation ligase (exosortase A-associated)